MIEPDLVVFDVDGTLQNTFAWWPVVLRRGLRRFADRYEVPIGPPSDRAANAVVGLQDAAVWSPFLPRSHRHLWAELRDIVVPLEVEEVASRDHLFPGVRELLAHLRDLGVRVALASNCHEPYLGAVCDGQGLAELSDVQLCLDSPGVACKADMIELAVGELGARRAVMVGDRLADLEAARFAEVPFVWRTSPHGELAGHDPRWSGEPDELLGILGMPGITRIS